MGRAFRRGGGDGGWESSSKFLWVGAKWGTRGWGGRGGWQNREQGGERRRLIPRWRGFGLRFRGGRSGGGGGILKHRVMLVTKGGRTGVKSQLKTKAGFKGVRAEGGGQGPERGWGRANFRTSTVGSDCGVEKV